MESPSHHKLVYDPSQVERFEKLFYNGTDNPETHLVCMCARRKYFDSLRIRKPFFKKELFFTKSRFEGSPQESRTLYARSLLQLVRTHEVPTDCYVDDYNQQIPTSALVLYASLNPRHTRQAAKAVGEFILSEAFMGSDFFNLVNKVKSETQKTALEKRYITLDLDEKHLLEKLRPELEERKFPKPVIIETRGGYHLIYTSTTLTSSMKQFLFRDLNKRDKIDVLGDPFCPIPGTLQGGFPVHFVDET